MSPHLAVVGVIVLLAVVWLLGFALWVSGSRRHFITHPDVPDIRRCRHCGQSQVITYHRGMHWWQGIGPVVDAECVCHEFEA